ncbi:MAG: molybdopterin converting factor subunit 1 [Silicimonas sp.]|nr:molybdopterin converting factor subunit 1 [Silicimonas sp.]NND20522.1 molybdopterin converting factor subunit 1 [Silicimonas sp.]NND42930.1 molybdopterin converting factor subunit 1 [Silicimonas sp.]NNF92324.1 molybdopterin converting factor subunit 1 [Boseongicola sp.]NNL34727.1 molybdopterin converting factor subunit 1 [Silicimonas sp.]
MDVLYFAWLRERIGAPKERVETSAATVSDLVDELKDRSEAHALAFADVSAVRAALDQELVEDFSAQIGDTREVAFFPPMTGG